MQNFWNIAFWVSGFVILYTYGGYGIFLFIYLKIRDLFSKAKPELTYSSDDDLPEVCLIIAAYNERDYVDRKIKNSLSLDYPKQKLSVIWVNDGSDDGTPDLVANYPEVILLHNAKRSGKVEGMNHGFEASTAPILMFSDANTMLSSNSLRSVVRHFLDRSVGCVAGEKQFYKNEKKPVAAVGEGLYWRIESWLKQLDYQFYSTIGATGELFAIRRELYRRVESDTLLDDFMISMRTTVQGFRVAYEPSAIAIENSSFNVHEELKRKIRIAAGCFQSMFRLTKILNPFFNFRLFFQYVSHKVLRWTLAPIALIVLLFSSMICAVDPEINNPVSIYSVLLILQLIFYGLAIFGYFTQNRPFKFRFIYTPFYFAAMNYAMFAGFFRFLKGKQSVLWEKAQRA